MATKELAKSIIQSMGGLDDVNDVEAYCQNLALFVMFSSLYCLCLISIPCSGNSYAIAVVRIRWTILNTVTGWIHITHPLMKTNGKNWCKKMLHLITSHWVMEWASNNDVKLFSHHNFLHTANHFIILHSSLTELMQLILFWYTNVASWLFYPICASN